MKRIHMSHSEQFLPEDAAQCQWVKEVLGNEAEEEDEIDFSVSLREDTGEVSEAQLQRWQELASQIEHKDMTQYLNEPEGPPRETGGGSSCSTTDDEEEEESSEPGSTSLQAVYAAYTQDSDTCETKLPAKRVLVLGGRSSLSLIYHLGVVLSLMEQGELEHYDAIWAEDKAVYLALKLRMYWQRLTSVNLQTGRYPSIESMWELMVVPMLEIATRSPQNMDDYFMTYWNLCWLGDKKPLAWYHMQSGPELYLCTTLPPLPDAPHRIRLTRASDWAHSKTLLASVSELRQGGLVSRPCYNSLWTAIVETTTELAVTGGQVHPLSFEISNGGAHMLPPIDPDSLYMVDASCLKDPWEFCSMACKIAESQQPETPASVEVTLYSPHRGGRLHATRGIQMLLQPFQATDTPEDAKDAGYYQQKLCPVLRQQAIAPLYRLEHAHDTLNWGYRVCQETRRSLNKLRGQPVQTLERRVIVFTEAEERLFQRARDREYPRGRMTRADSVDVLSLSGSKAQQSMKNNYRETQHTPCKWLRKWWAK